MINMRVVFYFFFLFGLCFTNMVYAEKMEFETYCFDANKKRIDHKSNCRNTVLHMKGGIGYNKDAEILEYLLKTRINMQQPYSEIYFTSPGGVVDEGYKIGRVFRRYSASVHIYDYCVSACTFAMLGAVVRQIDDKAKFGLHSASSYSEILEKPNFLYEYDDNKKLKSHLRNHIINQKINLFIEQFIYYQEMGTAKPYTIDETKNLQNTLIQTEKFLKDLLYQDSFKESLIESLYKSNNWDNNTKTSVKLQDILMSYERGVIYNCLHKTKPYLEQLGISADKAYGFIKLTFLTDIKDYYPISPEMQRTHGYDNTRE